MLPSTNFESPKLLGNVILINLCRQSWYHRYVHSNARHLHSIRILQWQFLHLLLFLLFPQNVHCQCYWQTEKHQSGKRKNNICFLGPVHGNLKKITFIWHFALMPIIKWWLKELLTTSFLDSFQDSLLFHFKPAPPANISTTTRNRKSHERSSSNWVKQFITPIEV